MNIRLLLATTALSLIGGLAMLASLGAAPNAPPLPGTDYRTITQLTTHGPVVYHVLVAPPPGGAYTLAPVLSGGTIPGAEPLTAIENDAGSPVAGINGDTTNQNYGTPTGLVLQNGALEHEPQPTRTSIGIGSDGTLHIGQLTLNGYWQGNGQRHQFAAINDPPGTSGFTLYTPAWGTTTPPALGAAEVVLEPFPATQTDTDLSAPVVQSGHGGSTPIPPDGAVLTANTTQAATLTTEVPTGTTVKMRLRLDPPWTTSGIVNGIGGGPQLVQAGQPVFHINEAFTATALATTTARSAIGQLADGRIALVTVDGADPSYSVGATNYELARLMAQLGCVTAAALASGPPAEMASNGQPLSRIPSTGEKPIADALLIQHSGGAGATP